MPRFAVLAGGLSLVLSSLVANAASDAATASAEQLLELTGADRMTVPVHAQVRQMFAQRFAEAGGQGREAVLESYQARADALLERAVGWERLRPELVTLYAGAFSEAELEQLVAFYRSPLGRKMLERLPELNMRSAQLTQARIEAVAPEVNQLLAEMAAQLQSKP